VTYQQVDLSDSFWFQEGPGVRKWQFSSHGVKLLNVANILKTGVIDLSKTDRHLSRQEVESKYSHFLADEGDLVIASSGISIDEDGFLKTRGAFLEKDHLPLCMNTSTIRFKPLEGVSDLGFLKHWLQSFEFRVQITKEVTGIAQKNFGPSHLKRIKISLPPLEEQKRIAGILDAADALRAKRREALAQLDTLLQSTFLDMFGKIGRPPISIGEPSFGDNKGFVPLSKYARLATGHTPDRNVADYWNGPIPWISLTDIRLLDGVTAINTLQRITEAGLKNSSAVRLPPGTVCFSRTASVGFVTLMGREMATSQDFVNWVCGDELNPVYLMWALRMSKPYLLSKSSGSTHKTIYYRHAEQFQVYLAPLDLQNRFAEIVESVENQKARMKAHLDELDTLFASLQSRAFNGEL
jgi:type I restriction enzyme S subunit